MYVVLCHLPHLVVVCIMSFLLMITQENVGYISLKLEVTHLINSKSIKHLLESRQGNTSESLEQTMEESLNLSSLRIYASHQESRDNWPCHITLSKMELLRGKTGQFVRQRKQWCLTRICQILYGQKLPPLPCIFRTGVHVLSWRTTLLKRSSQGSSPK